MSEPLDLDAIEARANAASTSWETREEYRVDTMVVHSNETEWSLSACLDCGIEAGYENHADAEFIAAARTDVPALIARVRELEPRVLDGDWETVRDALDALPEGAQIRWTTGDPIHVALGINRGAYWNVTTPGGPLSSDNIARDETPIEVIA